MKKKKQNNLYHKGTKKGRYDQEINGKNFNRILEIAYHSVVEGYSKSLIRIKNEKEVFRDLSLQSAIINADIKAIFEAKFESDYSINKRIKFFKARKTEFYLIDRKIFLSFKSIDELGIIKNIKTDRIKSILEGNDIILNQSVEKEFRRMKINEQPPIYFVGFNFWKGEVVNCIRYFNNEVIFNIDLTKRFKNIKETLVKKKDNTKFTNNSDDAEETIAV